MISIIGLLLFLLFISVGIGFGNILPMFDYPNMQLILGTIFACYLMAFKLNKIPVSLLGILSSKFKNTEEQRDAIHFSQIGFWASILSGVLASSIGLILLLVSKDWNNDRLGVNLALTIIPFVYSAILSILFICAKYRSIRATILNEND